MGQEAALRWIRNTVQEYPRMRRTLHPATAAHPSCHRETSEQTPAFPSLRQTSDSGEKEGQSGIFSSEIERLFP